MNPKSITGINYDSKHFIDQISKQRQRTYSLFCHNFLHYIYLYIKDLQLHVYVEKKKH